MNRRFAVIASSLFVAIQIAASQSPATGASGSKPAIEIRTLANGLRVIVAPAPQSNGVACRVVYKNGSADDPPAIPGFAELMTRLLDQGTVQTGVRDYDKEKESRRDVFNFEVTYRSFYKEALELYRRGEGPDPGDVTSRPESLQKLRDVLDTLEDRRRRDWMPGAQREWYARAGATRAAWRVEKDYTIFETTIPAERAELFFALEADRLQNAVLRNTSAARDELTKRRIERLEQIPAFAADEEFYTQMWAGERYAQRGAGADSLDAVSLEQLEREKLRFTSPSQIALVLAGNITIGQAMEWAEKYFIFPSWVPEREDTIQTIQFPARAFRTESEGIGPASVTFAWRIPGASHRDFPALTILREIAEAELAKQLHSASDGKSIITNGSVELHCYKYGGLFTIRVIATDNARLPAVEAGMSAACAPQKNPPAANTVAAAARREIVKIQRDLLSMDSLASSLAEFEIFGSAADANSYITKLENVTPADVTRVANRYLTMDRCGTFIFKRSKAAPMPRFIPIPAPPPVVVTVPIEAAASKPIESKPASQPAESQPAPATQPASGPAKSKEGEK